METYSPAVTRLRGPACGGARPGGGVAALSAPAGTVGELLRVILLLIAEFRSYRRFPCLPPISPHRRIVRRAAAGRGAGPRVPALPGNEEAKGKKVAGHTQPLKQHSTTPLGKEGIPNWGISKVPLLLAGERENLKGSGFMDDSQCWLFGYKFAHGGEPWAACTCLDAAEPFPSFNPCAGLIEWRREKKLVRPLLVLFSSDPVSLGLVASAR
nr:uncharacterized protein LOC115497013 isoform X2 [Taeniopygia guttata]